MRVCVLRFVIALLLTTAALARAQQADVGRAGPVRGVIVDDEGRPIAGAQVWAVQSQNRLLPPEEVAARATAADGRFEISIPARWSIAPAMYRESTGLVAFREGYGVAAIAIYRESPLPKEPIKLALPKPAEATVRITAPDDKAAAGVTATVSAVKADAIHFGKTVSDVVQSSHLWDSQPVASPWGAVVARLPLPLPAAVIPRLSAKPNAEGIATFSGVTQEQVAAIEIDAAEFGHQVFTQLGAAADLKLIQNLKLSQLMPVTGQLTAPAGTHVASKTVLLVTSGHYDPDTSVQSRVHAMLKTDDAGKFTARVSDGWLVVLVDWPADSPLQPAPPDRDMKVGLDTHINIPLLPTVNATGYVKNADTGEGVPGARVLLGPWFGVVDWNKAKAVITDRNGRYEVTLAQGPAAFFATTAPGYLIAPNSRSLERQTIVAGSPELKTIQMIKAAAASGVVIDDSGKPASGAAVTATWLGYDPAVQRADVVHRAVTADGEGRFEIGAIDPGAEYRLFASKKDAFARGVKVAKGDSRALVLPVSPQNARRLAGRITDTGGGGVSGAKLQLWRREWSPSWKNDEPVLVKGDEPLTSDPKGRFQTPLLPPDAAYRLALADPNFEPAFSAWQDLTTGNEPPEIEILASKPGEHAAVVRDSEGQPVIGALVQFQAPGRQVEATTNPSGYFRLKPAPDRAGYLFVSKDGFRFHGQELDTTSGALEIRLARLDEPYGQSLAPTPLPGSADERRKIALKLLSDSLAKVKDDNERYSLLRALAKIDPAAAVGRLNDVRLEDTQRADLIRFEAARALAATAPDDALEIAAATSIDHVPTMTTIRVAVALPADQRQRKLAILAEAQLKAQSIADTGFRVMSLAMVADALYRLDEKDRASKILSDQLEVVRKLATTGYDAYIRGYFAEKLARVDTQAAISLVEAIEDYHEKTRHLGNMAHEIAGLDPAEAERVLGLIPPAPENFLVHGQYDHYAERVCYRMAKVDLPRALRIAEAVSDPHQRALAFGRIGVAISTSDPKQATGLFRRAFDQIEQPAQQRRGTRSFVSESGGVAGWLVLNAHAFDPELAAECRWRLLRIVPQEISGERIARMRSNDALSAAASFLALVDPPTTRKLLERLDVDLQYQTIGARTWLPAWAILDPDEAIHRLPANSSAVFKAQYLAPAIAATGETRLKLIHHNAGIWQIDTTEDDL